MAVDAKKLGQAALNVSGSVVTLVTGKTGGHSEVTGIWLANTGSTARDVTLLAHGTGTTAANMIIPKVSIAAYSTEMIPLAHCPIILPEGDTLRAYQDTGTDVTATVYGIEEA